VRGVAYSPDGKSIATAIDNAHVRLWDATTGKPLRTLDGQQGQVSSLGKREEATALLMALHRGGWPLSDRQQWSVEQTRMRIRRLAGTDSTTDHAYALELIDTSLATYPMLRLDPEFMVSAIAVYASMGDPRADARGKYERQPAPHSYHGLQDGAGPSMI
jgi:WD40 repeat protein